MRSLPRGIPSRRGLAVLLLFLLFLGLVASRRWEQLVRPQVWDEDGLIINGFVVGGWRDFFQPVNGYLLLVPKILTRLSMAVSIYYYPMISTVLACVFTALVGTAVALSPTRLLGRLPCAVSVFLVPCNPEVFGLPLYTLWWAPVLLLLLAVWDEARPLPWLRLLYLILGGLSSPFIVFVLPVLCLRAVWFRKRAAEVALAVAGLLVAAAQMFLVARDAKTTPATASSLLQYAIPRFCGWFLGGSVSDSGALLWPLGLAIVVLVAAFLYRGRRDPRAWILVYLYCAAVGASSIRVDPAGLHPVGAGPRYFFFPYLLLFWILIQLALGTGRAWLRLCAGIAVLLAALNAIPQWSRRHDDLQWQQHIVSARLYPEYALPVELDGHAERAWYLRVSGPAWDNLLRSDWLLPTARLEELPTFAYRVVRTEGRVGFGPPMAPVGGATGARRIVFVTQGPLGDSVFTLPPGGRIRFRSGPANARPAMEVVGLEGEFLPGLPYAPDWVVLEFSNPRLPAAFTLRVRDQGSGVGEWSPAPVRN